MLTIGIIEDQRTSIDTVRRYLPYNYAAVKACDLPYMYAESIYVFGIDTNGWSFTQYVQPRLQSGMISVKPVSSFEYEQINRVLMQRLITIFNEEVERDHSV